MPLIHGARHSDLCSGFSFGSPGTRHPVPGCTSSVMAEQSVPMTGRPHAWDSIRGTPNPSAHDGHRYTSAALYQADMYPESRRPVLIR